MAEHRTIVVVDVARFTDPARTVLHQRTVHEGLYQVLATSLDEAGIEWKLCEVEDRGDGAMILVPPEIPKILLADQWPGRLLARLRRYNEVHSEHARMRLRVAFHAGEVDRDANGVVSQAVNLAFRILDAPAAKSALLRTAGTLALIVSDHFYRDVITADPAAEPSAFTRIDVSVKQTRATSWLRIFGETAQEPSGPADEAKPDLSELVDALLAVPVMRDNGSRQLVLELLPPRIGAAVAYNPGARLHVFSLVKTCLRYNGGLAALVAAVRDLDGDSPAIGRLDAIAGRWLSNSTD